MESLSSTTQFDTLRQSNMAQAGKCTISIHFVQWFSQLTKPPLLPGFPIAILIAMFDYRRAMFDLPIRCGKPGYNPLATRKPQSDRNWCNHPLFGRSHTTVVGDNSHFHRTSSLYSITNHSSIFIIFPKNTFYW